MKVVTRVKGLLAAAVAAAGLVAFAEPVVEITKAWQANPGSGVVDFTYEVRGLDGASCDLVVRVEAKGCDKTYTFTNENVSAGLTTTNVDYKTKLGKVSPNVSIYATLVVGSSDSPTDATGTPVGILADVMVVDVTEPSADTWPVKSYNNIDTGLFNCDVYKTSKIVLRKVSPGTYSAGYGENGDNQLGARTVEVTKTYYMALFETTAAQYDRVMGVASPSSAMTPKNNISWETIRGGCAANVDITASSPACFFQRLVQKTGIGGFDFPTELQWEIAARAGSTGQYGAFWSEEKASVAGDSSNAGQFAWYYSSSSSTVHPVGSLRPNLWGLYDTAGNVWESCRDNKKGSIPDGQKAEEYVYNSLNETYVARRGGAYSSYLSQCDVSGRYGYYTSDVDDKDGFRVCCTRE